MHCVVSIWTAWPSGICVKGWLGEDNRTSGCTRRRHRIRGNPDIVAGTSGGVAQHDMVYGTGSDRTDGMWSVRPHYHPAEGSYRHEDPVFPSSRLRPFSDGPTNATTSQNTCRGSEKTSHCGSLGGVTDWTRNDDPECMPIWWVPVWIEDAVSEYPDYGSQSGPGCSTGSGGKRPEIYQLHRLFMVAFSSVARLNRRTQIRLLTQVWQLSRQTVEDAVHLQSVAVHCLWIYSATRQGWWDYPTWRPTSSNISPGSSIWWHQKSGHCGMENQSDRIKELPVLLVLPWVQSCHHWHKFPFFSSHECPDKGVVGGNEGFLPVSQYARGASHSYCDVPELG